MITETIISSCLNNFLMFLPSFSGIQYTGKFKVKNKCKIVGINDYETKHNNFFKFYITKNPFSRIINYYESCFENPSPDKFSTFLEETTEDEILKLLPCQIDFFKNIETKFGLDFVFYVENFQNQLAILSSNFNTSGLKYSYNNRHYNEYFKNKSNISKVEKIYDRDLKYFGYEFSNSTANSNSECKQRYFNAIFSEIYENECIGILEKKIALSRKNIKLIFGDKKHLNEDDISRYSELNVECDSLTKQKKYYEETKFIRNDLLNYYNDDSNPISNNYSEFEKLDFYYITLNSNSITQKNKINALRLKLGNRLKVVDAIDSRDLNRFVYKDYDMKLYPMTTEYDWNFSSSFGAVGCYLSHMKVYAKIVEDKKNAVILEEDCDVKDVLWFIQKKAILPKNYEFIQLNKRIYTTPNSMLAYCDVGVDGTESYFISHTGASKIINATKNFKYFDVVNYSSFLKWRAFDIKNNIYDSSFFMNANVDSVETENAIRAPIDKFLYLNCSEFVPFDKKIKSFVLPLIGLDISSSNSSVLSSTPFWKMTINEVRNFESNCDTYKWWDRANVD